MTELRRFLKDKSTKYSLAAPSCVWPDRIEPNCRNLSGLVDEVALCFLEYDGCLRYDDEDLPENLAHMGLGYHVHLPVDLPWLDAAIAFDIVAQLADKAAFMRPRGFVLHPPPFLGMATDIAWRLRERGYDPSALLLENVENYDLTRSWSEVVQTGLGVCVDLGHLLFYEQWDLLDLPGLDDHLAMIHAYAPGMRDDGGHKHQSLAGLDEKGKMVFKDLLRRLPAGGCLVLEVFDPEDLESSMAALRRWEEEWGLV